jgi:HEAT repeat protein
METSMRLSFYIVVLGVGASLAVSSREAAALPLVPQAQADPADSLYRQARRALDEKNYDAAARLFESIVARYPRSIYAPDALYWRGFSLYRNGNLEGAEAALEAQAARYPNAATRADASPLLILVKGELAKRGDTTAGREVARVAESTEPCGDMEVRIAALDALQQMDDERVMPLLRRVLTRRDACSAPLRKNALFILAQKGGAERDKLLLDIAKSDPSAAVRNDAVFYLGQARSDAAVDALENILLTANENAVRSNALFALAQMRTDRTTRIIQQFALKDGVPNNLRNDALFHVAQHPAPETNRWLLSVIGNASAPMELRKNAIFHLAQQKADASDAISRAYDASLPLQLKKDLVFHIAQRKDDASLTKLIAIAKTEPNLELRKDALFHLAQSRDARALKALEDMVTP